ncbi:MAG: lipocalin family protein [Bacteroidota bacterium]
MKIFRFFGVLLFAAVIVSSPSCGEEPVVVLPVSVKILGLWQQIEAKEEGFVITLDPYYTMDFNADQTVVIKEFDGTDDTELDSTDDMWELTNDNTEIDFDVSTDVEIVEITDTRLVIRYQGANQIGQSVEKEDTFQKQ